MAWFEQNVPVENDALPPVLDVEPTPDIEDLPPPSRTQDSAIADMKVMLEEMERHYGKRPIIYTSVDFYEAILSDGALLGLSDVGALDQAPPVRANTARASGSSGSTRPMAHSRASTARSTATCSTARRSNGTRSSIRSNWTRRVNFGAAANSSIHHYLKR